MEHLTPISVFTRSAQDQCQLKEEDVEPLKGNNFGLMSIFSRNYIVLVFFFNSSNIRANVCFIASIT